MATPIVSVIGGGQLARMMAPPAAELGVTLRVLVESDGSSAAQVVVDSPVGKASDTETIKSLVTGANVLTFEHEHVPGDFLRELISQGVSVQPHPDALLQAQDKIIMRERLTDMGLPCPAWRALDRDTATATTQLHEFIAQHGPDVVVKTSRGGYDGKGVRVVSSPEEVNDWFDGVEAGGPALLVEEKVPFSRELAVLVARRPAGDAVTWPVVESIQENGVCAQVIAPAPNLTQDEADRAREVALKVAHGLDVTGVLAVEMFETRSDSGETNIFINELAMRPHNSGHWTITGSVTSQFEQHLRAVLDLPLGDTAPLAPWTVMANILGSNRETLTDALPQVLAQYPNAKVNLYGKEPRPGRKLGHVNVSGSDLEQVLAAARGAAALVRDQD
ncbi:5-(carboxyamino)imidazole ribonucleotide synthase [Populibacterium corticicola]|uniref:N5-carboxyaminoimidazole ribonucleotide synthase n=1 Tax=Populibacterium corticicola TaxID=1812826 RepID=A0ABW5XF04_9MICO